MITFQTPRPTAVRHELARLPGVIRVELFRALPVRLRWGPRADRSLLLGLEREAELRRLVDLGLAEYPVPAGGVVLTRALADRLGVVAGGQVTIEVLEGSRGVYQMPVAGTVDEVVGRTAYLDLPAAQRLVPDAPGLSGAFLRLDRARADSLYVRLKQLPAVSGLSDRHAALAGFERTLEESFSISLAVLISFATVIAVGVVYNGARVALSERGRELASLRILGFARREVAVLLLGEQALLTLLGLPAGFALGFGLCALLVQRFEMEMFRLPLVVSGTTYGFAALVVLGAAVGSAVLVRRRLDRMDLVSVLKTRE